MIEFSKNRLFHLYSRSTSYVMRVTDDGILEHVWYGRRLKNPEKSFRAIGAKHMSAPGLSTALSKETKTYSLSDTALECSSEGKGDYRTPLVSFADIGTLSLKYRAHRAYPGVRSEKSKLPASRGEGKDAETLEILLTDDIRKIEVTLVYTLFRELDVITRRTIVKNTGSDEHVLTSIGSVQTDIDEGGLKLTSLQGAWAREAVKKEKTLSEGITVLESRRWNSSTETVPAFALENSHRDAWAWSLMWSSTFRFTLEEDSFRRTHVVGGLNPETLSVTLKGGEEFESPECITSYSREGTEKAGAIISRFITRHVARKESQARLLPIMLSTSELGIGTSEDKVVSLIKKAPELGIEGIMLDDGWFGARKDRWQSLGDWYVNPMKFPHGMKWLSNIAHDKGLLFGLSFDIEAVNRISGMYMKHPEWALHEKKENDLSGRYDDLLLDLRKSEVRDALVTSISSMIDTYSIDALRLSGSRSQSENGKGRDAYDWMLGLYDVISRIVKRYPKLFVSYSMAGGSRLDAGMLSLVDTILLSENTDPTGRMKSAEGSALFFPPWARTMRVSASPDRMLSRYTDLESRFDLSSFGALEYSIDVTMLTKDEEFSVRQQTEFYKQYREVLQRGEMVKLDEDDSKAVWAMMDRTRDTILALYLVKAMESNRPHDRIRIEGATEDALYMMSSRDRIQTEIRDSVYPQELECYEIGGDALAGIGVALSEKDTGTLWTDDMRKLADHSTRLYIFRKEQ